MHAQTHVASSYDGDETGRFHDRYYELGQRMAWWPKGHPKFGSWTTGAHSATTEIEAVEACYSSCLACKAELFAIVQFQELVPKAIIGFGLEREWPDGFSK